jgi:hypothetical protein
MKFFLARSPAEKKHAASFAAGTALRGARVSQGTGDRESPSRFEVGTIFDADKKSMQKIASELVLLAD